LYTDGREVAPCSDVVTLRCDDGADGFRHRQGVQRLRIESRAGAEWPKIALIAARRFGTMLGRLRRAIVFFISLPSHVNPLGR
jgi:hypothetical protein